MKSIFYIVRITLAMLFLLPSLIDAASITIQPENIASIDNPDNKNETRVVMYFSMPEKLMAKNIHIDMAKLVFLAELSNTNLADIEICPVTTAWTGAGSIDWKNSWVKEGGDYTIDNSGERVTIKESQKSISLTSNVTFLVQAWIDGSVDNKGIILIPSYSMDGDSKSTISIDTNEIELVINYNYQGSFLKAD